MRTVYLHIIWVACIVIVAGAVLPNIADTGSSTPFVTLAAGATSRIRKPEHLAIHDYATWQKLWSQHSGLATVPPVNFKTDMVIAVFAGEVSEPSTIVITKIVHEFDRLVVFYRVGPVRPPLDGSDLSPAAPFHIVRTGRSPLPVIFTQIKTPPVFGPPP